MGCHSGRTMFKKVRTGLLAFYSEPTPLGNGAQGQVVRRSPTHADEKTGLLRHAPFVECCHPHIPVSDRVYSRAVSVHRFQRVAGRVQEGRCRTTTRKPTYGRGCGRVVSFCKPSSSCGPQTQVTARLTQNTCATSAQIGGAATESCKWLGTNTIKSTWVPASDGLFGCSIEGSTTTGRSSSTTLVAKTCNALPACGPLIVGALPQRKADRPAPHLPNRRGNGRCATLPRQQRTRTRTQKQSRPAPARRAVA
jgi:hypothetical protein